LRDNLLPFLIALPSHPVKVGDFWEQPHVTDLGPIGRLEETRKYSFKGKGEDNLERIQVAVLAKYAKPDPAAVAGLPFKIAKADFKCLDSGGLIKFDNRNGRVASMNTALAMFGVFYIEIGGQETEVELTMLKSTTLKVTGPDLPAPSAAPVDVTPCAQIVPVSCRPCPGLRHRLFQRWRRSR
jgi:hypothetical protein